MRELLEICWRSLPFGCEIRKVGGLTWGGVGIKLPFHLPVRPFAARLKSGWRVRDNWFSPCAVRVVGRGIIVVMWREATWAELGAELE